MSNFLNKIIVKTFRIDLKKFQLDRLISFLENVHWSNDHWIFRMLKKNKILFICSVE
jgi:hypothetical protein